MKGILGKKIGMTQVFTTNGKLIPVTVIEVEPNVVTQVKTLENDGYEAIQLATCTIREKVSNKPKMGHTKKANTEPKRFLREIRGVDVNDYSLGQIVSIDKENNVILVKGNVPGPKKSLVIIHTAVKNPGVVNTPADLISYVPEKVEEVATESVQEETVENAE